jgi:hypothetical protein
MKIITMHHILGNKVYEAYNDNKVLKSINNGTVKPTVSINRSTS